MLYFQNQRRSIRLSDYNYSQSGAYFITILVKDKNCLLGNIVDNKIVLSDIGIIIKQCWLEIPDQFSHILLDEYTIMPNHLHGIIVIDDPKVGVQFIEPEIENKIDLPIGNIRNNPMKTNNISLGKVIRYFKAKTTYLARKNIAKIAFSWQRNYYEHIIRNNELEQIRDYIIANPEMWQYDQENEQRLKEIQYRQKWGYLETKIYGKI
jgi:putative transposase